MRLHPRIFALAALLLTAACRPHLISVPRPVALGATPYDSIIELACHNCYENGKEIPFSRALEYTNTLEIDIRAGTAKDPQVITGRTWFVRHDRGGRNNNDNSCPPYEKENDLIACLHAVRDWLSNRPAPIRPVVTIFLDLKDREWEQDRTPADLDRVLTNVFGDDVFTPGDLRGSATSVRAAAREHQWPRLDALRGNVIVALTGNNLTLREYLRERGSTAAAFVAPEVKNPRTVLIPNHFATRDTAHLAFYNVFGDWKAIRNIGPAIRGVGGIGRMWLHWENSRLRLPEHQAAQRFCGAVQVGFQRPATEHLLKHQLCSSRLGSAVERPSPTSSSK